MKNKILLILIPLLLITMVVSAHGGKTDGTGGHRDNQNKSGLGYYHYHCNGYPAHLHENGACPYKQSFAPKTSSNNNIISDGTVTKSKEKSKNVTIEFDNKPKKTEKAPEQVPEKEPEQPLILTILKWILGGLWILWMIGIVGTILMSIIEYIAESRGCLITALVCIGLIIIYIVYKVIST